MRDDKPPEAGDDQLGSFANGNTRVLYDRENKQAWIESTATVEDVLEDVDATPE